MSLYIQNLRMRTFNTLESLPRPSDLQSPDGLLGVFGGLTYMHMWLPSLHEQYESKNTSLGVTRPPLPPSH